MTYVRALPAASALVRYSSTEIGLAPGRSQRSGLVAVAEIERLGSAQGATRIEIKIGNHKASALRGRNGRLASFLRQAQEAYGDINVTMIISVPRGKGRDEDRHALLDDLRDIAPVAPGAADRVRARLVFAEPDGVERSRLVELTEHHITAKRRVSAVDDDGNSIRILSAVDAILDVAAEHEGELRAAVGADLG